MSFALYYCVKGGTRIFGLLNILSDDCIKTIEKIPYVLKIISNIYVLILTFWKLKLYVYLHFYTTATASNSLQESSSGWRANNSDNCFTSVNPDVIHKLCKIQYSCKLLRIQCCIRKRSLLAGIAFLITVFFCNKRRYRIKQFLKCFIILFFKWPGQVYWLKFTLERILSIIFFRVWNGDHL